MIIFTIEAILKIIAQRCDYFKDSWNLFDFIVVVGTIVILTIAWAGVGKDLEILGTILRTLRIGRVFRLIKKQQKLQEIFKTLLDATPGMASLGLLLMLLIFMFSIIGMSQFALVDIGPASEMSNHVNFQTFGAAFLTLVRCSTGEAWNSIMFDSSQSYSILNQCEKDEDYAQIVREGRDPNDPYGPKGCGNGFAIAFHLLFQVIVSQVFLNLFIAIIIDAFFGQTDLAAMPVKEKSIEDYQRIWSKFDRDATGFIKVSDLGRLLQELAKSDPTEGGALIPFKKRIANNEEFRNRQIILFAIPTYQIQKKVMFYDVLIRLCFQSVKLYFEQKDVKKMQKQLQVLKKIGGFAMNDDTLEALHTNNIKPNGFDRDFSGLIEKMKDPNPKAEIVTKLNEESLALLRKYNENVDTNLKVIEGTAGEEAAAKSIEQGYEPSVELYTTAHLGSALFIHEFIVEYLNRRASVVPSSINPSDAPGPGGNMNRSVRSEVRNERFNPIAEVSSHQENTNIAGRSDNASATGQNAAVPVLLPSAAGQPDRGMVEQEPADDHDESSAMQDQDWRNLR